MALFWRQLWTLTSKNLIITLKRRWLSTPMRAFIVPLILVLLLSYARNLLYPRAVFGIGKPQEIRSLSAAIGAVSGGRDRIVFVNSGLTGGAIDRVISSVAAPLVSGGVGVPVQVRTFPTEAGLRSECRSSARGSSRCVAAVVFHSSPSEGPSGLWNYSMRADGALGLGVDVDAADGDARIYTLPLQHAIDFAIGEIELPSSSSLGRSRTVSEYPFTSMTNGQRDDDIQAQFMGNIISVLAIAYFVATMIGVLYQLAGLMATERETGMAQLLDTMMPNRLRWQPQAARFTSHHLSFALLYGPGWVLAGVVMGLLAFRRTSVAIPLVSNLLCGLAMTSFAVFGGAWFRRAQLSGITAALSGLVLAVVAQLSHGAPSWAVGILAVLFPPANYVYVLVAMARWERENKAGDVLAGTPGPGNTLPILAFWIFAVYQTVAYPLLGAIVEQWLFGITGSGSGDGGRRTDRPGSSVAVRLEGFTKVYQASWLQRAAAALTKKKVAPTVAVDNLSLDVFRGEITVLLGANGSGKSTTLDAVAGMHSASAGRITLSFPDPTGGFGHCPQKNVLWDELSVREHVKVFSGIKRVGGGSLSRAEIDCLIRDCDLAGKTSTQAQALSGGQKRKLQLALMLAGGSSICCVDEVSSGVDPLSRRRLWDILLAERGRRTILLTTHFLDEADLLADRVAILVRGGSLRAAGTAAELKQNLGAGYRVHVYDDLHDLAEQQQQQQQQQPPLGRRRYVYRDVMHSEGPDETVYFPGSSADTSAFLRRLEDDGVFDYQVAGPTLEDVFLRVAGEEQQAAAATPLASSPARGRVRGSVESAAPLVSRGNDGISGKGEQDVMPMLQSGRRTGMAKQARVLFVKRLTVLRRNWAPHLTAVLIPIIAAACSALVLRNITPVSCDPDAAALSSASSPSSSSSAQGYRLVAGPRDRLSEAALQRISQAPAGAVTFVETRAQFDGEVARQFAGLTPGGFFVGREGGEEPVFAWRADGTPAFAHLVQSLLDSMLLNVTIASGYQLLDVPSVGGIGGSLVFTTYFGLAMAAYPAFLALYPTVERLRGIRAMHYSNGVSAGPLWLAYLGFDFLAVLAVGAVAAPVLRAVTGVWYRLEYVFLVFLLHGVAATLFSYVVSLFAGSQLAALAVAASVECGFYLVFFVAYLATFTYTAASNQTTVLNAVYYGLGAVSPSCSLARALYLTLNIFGLACQGRQIAAYPGAIDVFGGPILYLIVQSLCYLAVLLLVDSGFSLRQWLGARAEGEGRQVKRRGGRGRRRETFELQSGRGSSDCLEVSRLQKKFKGKLVVDDVSFRVPKGECLALLGPNGAGKTTCISMIRGELAPSGRASEVLVDGVSMLGRRSRARALLGVCPQVDPLDDGMTVAEHLRFYGAIRGVDVVKPGGGGGGPDHDNARVLLDRLGLRPFAGRPAGELSGGNRRRLSLGIALMGNPGVLLLDEPSSGMDAAGKRLMWRALASVVPGRSLVLTTHSMEEADALADRAAIISRGRVLASGTTERLRRRYGGGYSVHMTHADAPRTSAAEMEAVGTWIRRQFPEAAFERSGLCQGQARFHLPSGSRGDPNAPGRIAEVFERIEMAKARLGIEYYCVSRATLEQIFLSVVGREEDDHRGAQDA